MTSKVTPNWGRVGGAIEALADEPRPSAAKLLSGTGRERIWRIVVGQYRVLYQVTDVRVTVAIVRVADRREVYNATAIRRLLGRLRGSHDRLSLTEERSGLTVVTALAQS